MPSLWRVAHRRRGNRGSINGGSGEVVIATVSVGCKCFPREKLLSRYEARRIATNIAKLPDLLRKLR
jgi:hypothetical protein